MPYEIFVMKVKNFFIFPLNICANREKNQVHQHAHPEEDNSEK